MKFNWHDPFNIELQLHQEEIILRDQFRVYCKEKLLPRIVQANRNESMKVI